MSAPILATKLYIPAPRLKAVLRPRLTEQLNAGLHRKLTLIAAPAGFGKTTLISEWAAACQRPIAWLSLEAGDTNPVRFLTYLVAALQTIVATIGAGVLEVLQSPQPPPHEAILTALLNELSLVPNHIVLVLDDYHVIDAEPLDAILAFLVEHLPPQLHLVIATRADPALPLARLRARAQLTELRAADLRFTPAEAAAFLMEVMGLNVSAENVAALESRTEGWIAGLQLAALSLQGHHDPSRFISSFTGSHHFVLDYLLEEVLQQQPERLQTFLLRTSILDRLCGPLCDAVLRDPAASGQGILERIEHANLFIVPLDNERRWYRYHHLFAELLRQRLHQSAASSPEGAGKGVAELHRRASQWYEDNGLALEAFQHAAAANDLARAERLLGETGLPRHFLGSVTAILDWLASLPSAVLHARPWLWWRYASLLLMNGQTAGVEEKLQAAEAALHGVEADDQARNLMGQIAATRATLALTQYQLEPMLAESRRALAYLHSSNLSPRARATWTLGVAYQHQGDRLAARGAYTEAIALSQACGDTFTTALATIGLGDIQAAANQLYAAAETYQRALHLLGDPPLPVAGEAHLSLARILYAWNDLAAAEQHGRAGLRLARQFDRGLDRFIIGELFLFRLKLAQGDPAGAAALLAEVSQSVRQHTLVHRMAEVAAAHLLMSLREGTLAVAAHLVQTHNLPIGQARVHLAQGDPAAALAVLEPLRQQAEAQGWHDERLNVMVVEALALQAHGQPERALHLLSDALTLAEPGGLVRIFVDEGRPMAHLLTAAMARGMLPDYVGKLLSVVRAEAQPSEASCAGSPARSAHPLIEPLSERERDVLRLLRTDLSGPQIARELIVSLSTMRTHTKNIYSKLGVTSRRAAVHRAEELDLF